MTSEFIDLLTFLGVFGAGFVFGIGYCWRNRLDLSK